MNLRDKQIIKNSVIKYDIVGLNKLYGRKDL